MNRPIEYIFLHIPKTGGTSFYQVIQQALGDDLSVRYNRSMVKPLLQWNKVSETRLNADFSALYGHFYYREVKKIHRRHQSKVICWMRDPIERVVSNYRFFIKGLKYPYSKTHPNQLKKNYLLNKHRINETLLEYARKKETQNRISHFLKGINLEDIFFVGFLETFDEDVQTLAELLGWDNLELPHLNAIQSHEVEKPTLDETTLQLLRKWNKKDIALYQQAQNLKTRKW